MNNRPGGFYTCWLLWCLDIKSLWMTETLILEISGVSCSNFALRGWWTVCSYLSTAEIYGKNPHFISLGDWLLGYRWTEGNLFFYKMLLVCSSFIVIPFSNCHSMSLLLPAGASVWSLNINANTDIYPRACIQLLNSKGKRGWLLLFSPAGPLSTSVELQSPLCPWAGRDNGGCLSKQQNTGSKCWSHSCSHKSEEPFCAWKSP